MKQQPKQVHLTVERRKHEHVATTETVRINWMAVWSGFS